MEVSLSKKPREIKLSLKLLWILSLALIFTLVTASVAYAGYAYGAYKTGSSPAGVTYQTRNYVYTSSSEARAYTTICSTNATQASGYLAAEAQLLSSTGSVVAFSATVYNSSTYQINHSLSNSAGSTSYYGSCKSSAPAYFYVPSSGSYSPLRAVDSPYQTR
jgi:hypothetical protein